MITLDPSDPTGNTLYVGTGEPNGSGDSNAGLGIYKSTDGGDSWTHLAANTSVAAAMGCGATPVIGPYSGPAFDGRSISSIVVDGNTLYVGSARGVLGDGVPSGGEFSQNPNFPPVGLWKSINGGATFTLIGSPVPVCNNPLLPGGAFLSSFGSLRGVNHVELDPSASSTVYAGVFGRGIRRSTDSGATFAQIFKPASSSSADRTEFAATHLSNGKTRIYAGDGANSSTSTAFYRADDATQTASGLFDGTNNTAAWKNLTSSDRTNPYYATFNYCTGQCVYDNFVVSPPGHPDEVAHHRGGGGVPAGAAAVQHQLAHRVAFDEHRVERLAHRGERVLNRDHGGVHSYRDLTVEGLHDGEELHDVTQAPRHRDVPLSLRSTRKYPDGVVQLRYKVTK